MQALGGRQRGEHPVATSGRVRRETEILRVEEGEGS